MKGPGSTYRLIKYSCGHILRSHDDYTATQSDINRHTIEQSRSACRWCRNLAELRKEARR